MIRIINLSNTGRQDSSHLEESDSSKIIIFEQFHLMQGWKTPRVES